MYYIQLMLTKKCNQSCYYCTTHKPDDIEVDIDYLKWVLNQLPSETGVELTGGEIGLVPNIDDVYKVVKDQSNIKHIIAMSNGLLRQRDIDWLKDVEYWEHLIYEIKGREIIKFYSDLDLEQDHKYIIVTTESTTNSLLANWDYFKKIGILRSNFFYKLMNHKSRTTIDSYFNSLFRLYLRLKDAYFQKMLIHYSAMKNVSYIDASTKLLCQKYPPNSFIDLQTKQLGHCAINVESSNKIEFSQDNLLKLMIGELSNNDYCEKCYSYDNGKDRTILNNRSYIQ